MRRTYTSADLAGGAAVSDSRLTFPDQAGIALSVYSKDVPACGAWLSARLQTVVI
jgi:hypothetical protein